MKNRIPFLFILTLFCFGSLFAGTYSGGNGTEGDPYRIATTADLIELSKTSGDWSSYFIQTADIAFDEDSSLVDWDGDGTVWDTDDESGFLPIGNSVIKFTGIYNGQDYKIGNLYIYRIASDNIALFGYSSLAELSNLTLENVSISGNNLVGSLAAYSDRLQVENCHASGKVNGVLEKSGGLIAYARITNVTNCHSSVDVTGGDDYVGGLIAHTETGCVINTCYSTGNVKNSSYGNSNGGLVGDNASSTIEYCYSNSTVYAYSTYTGGFAGRNAGGTITNCYSTGDVTAISSTAYIGGFTSYNYSSGVISNCYSTGHIGASVSNTYDGGFAGKNSATISLCFWDTETSGMTLGIASGTLAGATGKTTVEMTTPSTFSDAGWDFTTVWTSDVFYNDSYPYLLDNPSSDIPLSITLVSLIATPKNGVIELTWKTASETDNARFLVYRNGEVIASVDGAGTSSEPHSYTVTDNAVVPGVTYTYVLADISYANKLVKHEDIAVTATVANDVIEADFTIGAAYPNPFNPTAVLPFKLTGDAMVKASLYDLNGQEIKSLVNGNYQAGTHTLHLDGAGITTGVYLVKILVNDIMNVQKIALIK